MFRKLIKKLFCLHDIDDLQADALCGCCGNKHYTVVEKQFPYAACRKCKVLSHDFMAGLQP
jgi:hypothetical protein